jgi:hypothetical protein
MLGCVGGLSIKKHGCTNTPEKPRRDNRTNGIGGTVDDFKELLLIVQVQ